MHPLIPLLHLVVHKVRWEGADVIAILPWWIRRGWFPLVLSLLANLLVLFPAQPSLIRNPHRLPPPSPQHPAVSRLAAPGETLWAAEGILRQLCIPLSLVRDNLRRKIYMMIIYDFCCWCDEKDVDPLYPAGSYSAGSWLFGQPGWYISLTTHFWFTCLHSFLALMVVNELGWVAILLTLLLVVGHKVCCPLFKLRVSPWDLHAILVTLTETLCLYITWKWSVWWIRLLFCGNSLCLMCFHATCSFGWVTLYDWKSLIF